MKSKKLIITFFLVLISILCVVGYFDYQKFEKNKIVSNTSKKTNTEKKETAKKKIEEKYDNPIPALIESYQNPEIVAKLSIPPLNFDEIVARSYDNSFYLSHDLYKNESQLGAIFVDYRTKDLDNAKQINIYGHNSDFYTLPFKALENFMNKDFFDNNPYIYLYTTKQKLTYKVFATRIITSEDEHTIISYGDNQAFLNHVNKLRENVLYDTGEEILKDDKLLILQTCLYNPEGRKILVMAKLTKTK